MLQRATETARATTESGIEDESSSDIEVALELPI